MKEEGMWDRKGTGRFLNDGSHQAVRHRKRGSYLSVILLLAWDGLLLYMIVECLIAPVYGAAFVAAISIYLGYQL